MSKFPPPKFYATDKDIHDLLTRFSAERLIKVSMERGMILSHQTEKFTVINYLSRQMYSHPQLDYLVSQMDKEEKHEKTTPAKLDADLEIDQVAKVFETIRDARKDPDEQMIISHRPSGELEVKVKYTDFDFSQATLRQRTSEEITFVVKKSGNVLDFNFKNNSKAAEIFADVRENIKGGNQPTITESVSLAGINDPAQRTQFFLSLMNGMEGFRLREVKDIKAERFKGLNRGGEEAESAAKEQVETLVRKMALAGDSVWTSPEFLTMTENGFFVYSAKWRGTETEGENRTIEFEAGFSSGECLDFNLRVLGVYNRNSDGNLEIKLSPLSPPQREALRWKMQQSAFDALGKIPPTNKNEEDTPDKNKPIS
jgi:hypothetical protein